jgi:hypothetical protein
VGDRRLHDATARRVGGHEKPCRDRCHLTGQTTTASAARAAGDRRVAIGNNESRGSVRPFSLWE